MASSKQGKTRFQVIVRRACLLAEDFEKPVMLPHGAGKGGKRFGFACHADNTGTKISAAVASQLPQAVVALPGWMPT
jgi:hypothetical protein